MLEKSRNAMFFQWFVCQVSRKVGLLKRRVRSHVVSGEIKNCTPLWRKAHFEAKMYKTRQSRNTFWRADAEKLYAAVAKSTFGSENAQNMTCLDHFCTCWCWKNARGCGERHIWKSKSSKHDVFGPLLDVLLLKKCMRLWRKAHLEVKMFKNCSLRSTFGRSDVQQLYAAVAKSTFGSENVEKL